MKLAHGVLVTPTPQGAVLLHQRTGAYFEINTTAARIIDLIGTSAEADSIANTIATETGAPLDQVSADVRDLLGQFQANGLIEATR